METFFNSARLATWAHGPLLHYLVLLNRYEDYCAYVRAHRDLLGKFTPHVCAVPERWLHATVQGIHHPTTSEQTALLVDATTERLAGMRPFRVQLGPTWPGVTAVTAAMYPEDGMADLTRRVRAGALSVPGVTLRPEENWPHTTLAYARDGGFDDRPLNRRLRGIRPDRPDIEIDRVHLVSQRLDPEAGYYTWDIVHEFVFE